MIIDCHTHLSGPDYKADPDRHRAACKEMDGVFILAGMDGDRTQSNHVVSSYLGNNSKSIGFCVIDPREDPLTRKEVKIRTLDQGLRGVVLYCAEADLHPAHSRAMRLYEQCSDLGLVVFFHNSPPFSSSAVLDHARPWLLDEIARAFPDLRIIVGRMGVPFIEQTACLLAKHPNVYADLTINPRKVWQVYNMVVSAYEAGVMDKLLFGSGYPSASPNQCIETLLGFNKLLSDTHLPQVPREKLRSVVERDSMALLGFK